MIPLKNLNRKKRVIRMQTIFGLLCLSSVLVLLGQTQQPSQDHLEKLRLEIQQSEERLRQLEKRAVKSEAAGKEVKKQTTALDSLITHLEKKEGMLAKQMIGVRRIRDSLSDVRAKRQAEYTGVARALFKRSLLTPSPSMLLLPEEQRKLALAEVLFSRYTRRQSFLANEVIALTDSLSHRDAELGERREAQLQLLSEQRRESEKTPKA